MKNKTLKTTLLAILASTHQAFAEERSISSMLGVTHMNPLYNFTTKPVLEEGADVVANMGAGGIKLWYGGGYRDNYPQNHDWPNVSNAAELAQTEYFSKMFSDPRFNVYALEYATFNSHTSWKNGFTETEADEVYQETYNFTLHLLQTYQGTGKTFILQNWEGDNNLGQNADPIKVQGMIDWLNTRQQAISDAVAAAQVQGVNVYGAAECNKVGQPNWEGPRMITDVFPHLSMDLYSYSNWYTRESEEQLLIDLNQIKYYAPDSETFGHENVFLGEFGNKRLVGGGATGELNEDNNFLVSKTELEVGLDVGARYAFFWMAYDSNTVKSHGLVLDQTTQQSFVPEATVDVSGRYYSKAHNYFRDEATHFKVFEDFAQDLSKTSANSNIRVITDASDKWDFDPNTFDRATFSDGVLEYTLSDDLKKIAIPTFEDKRKKNRVTAYTSATGEDGTFVEIPLSKISGNAEVVNWERVLYRNASPITQGHKHVKITFTSSELWSPKISAIRLYSEAPKQAKTVVFGGKVEDFKTLSFQQQIDANELVQWTGLDSWGNIEHTYGSLHQSGINGSIKALGVNTELEVTSIASANEQKLVVSGGVLGIHGGANAKLDAANGEAVTVGFSKEVELTQLVLGGFDYATEEITLTHNGESQSYRANDLNLAPALWGQGLKVLTLPEPIRIQSGETLSLSATAGQWGVSALVTEIQP